MYVQTIFISSTTVLDKFRESVYSKGLDKLERLRIIKNKKSPEHFLNYRLSDLHDDPFTYICILKDQSSELNLNPRNHAIFRYVYCIIWDGTMRNYDTLRKQLREAIKIYGIPGKPLLFCFDLTGTFFEPEFDFDIVQIKEIDFETIYAIIDSRIRE